MGVDYKAKRRSILFFPALNEGYCRRALDSTADSVVFDLEDSVHPNYKADARTALLKNFPRDYHGPKELMVRINDPRTPWYNEDLATLKELQPSAIFTSKTESPDEINELEKYLSSYETGQQTEIIVVIESSQGYFNAGDILGSSNRISGAAIGVEDMASQFGVPRGKLWENPLLAHVLAELAIVCHHYGMQYIGPPTRGYKTDAHMEEIREECEYFRSMGARGMVAIHPNQLDIINSMFDITPDEIDEARRIIKVFEEAGASGKSLIGEGDEMQGPPSLKRAETLLQYADEHGFLADQH